MLDIHSIEEYNVVKYIRHKSERRKDESCERISQGTGHFPARTAKDIGVSRQTINMIENDKYNPTLELCLNLARDLKLTSIVSFGRMIF